jgi:hypothetical protein
LLLVMITLKISPVNVPTDNRTLQGGNIRYMNYRITFAFKGCLNDYVIVSNMDSGSAESFGKQTCGFWLSKVLIGCAWSVEHFSEGFMILK